MIKKFGYINAKDEFAKRKLLVIHESGDKLQGFDLNKMSKEDARAVVKAFGKKPVTPIPAVRERIDYDNFPVSQETTRDSYRTFNKDNIVHTKNPIAKIFGWL